MAAWARTRLAKLLAGICLAAPVACDDKATQDAVRLLGDASVAHGNGPRHRGERRVEFWDAGRHHVHVERIFAGHGDDLGIDLLSVNGAAPSPVSRLLFVGQARYLHRFRDLAVDDADLALANYAATIVSTDESVAGRPAIHLRFAPRHGVTGAREAWVDQQSGLALRIVRHGADGEKTFQLEYLTVEVGPVSRIGSDPATLPAAPRRLEAGASALEFTPLAPGWIPKGFRLAETDVVMAGNAAAHTAARRDRFTDGLEHILVIQGDAKSGLWGAAQIETEVAGPPNTTIGSFRVGAVSVVVGARRDCVISALGRIEGTLLDRLVLGYHGR